MKALKKFGSVVLAICLCFTLCNTSALAANSNDTEGSITITGAVAGEEYTIYQIFEMTYADDGSSYSYQLVEGWSGLLSMALPTDLTSEGHATWADYITVDSNGYVDPDSDIFDEEAGSAVMVALAQDALSYATTSNISGITVSYTIEDGRAATTVTPEDADVTVSVSTIDIGDAYTTASLTISPLNLGYWLIDTSLGTLCMLTSTDPDAVINEKNEVPDLEKYVDHQTVETTDNGFEVEYEIDIDHITGVSSLVLHDVMDSELELEANTFVVTLYDYDSNGVLVSIELTAGIDYIIGTPDEGESTLSDGCSFEIYFTVDDVDYDFSGCSEDAYIEVIYDCLIHTEGDEYEYDEDIVDNFAMITYGNAGRSEWREAEVELFGFEIFKYTDAQDDGIDIITVPVYNDSVAGQQDYLYLALVDLVDGEESITYFAVFSEVEDQDNVYYISDWIEESRVDYIQQNPFVILGYYEDGGTDLVELSYVLEPDESVTEDAPITLIFYYEGSVPSHDYIVLDEFGTASMEEDVGSDEYILYGTVQAALSGAEFELTNSYGNTAYFLEETVDLTDENGDVIGTKHMYLLEGWLGEDEELPDGYTTTLVSDDIGMINVEGLNYGTYTLTETKAPDGYNLLLSPIVVTIDSDGFVYEDGTVTSDKVIEVLNNQGLELPSTGGIGTTVFYVAGICLMLGAAVLLITRRRMRAAE